MENIIEWIGYLASFIILVSLIMTSIKKLRIINLVGALLFAFYGYQIASPPVMIMNLGIVVINLYYLKQIYVSSEYFNIMPFTEHEGYGKRLLDFYQKDIQAFMPLKNDVIKEATHRFLILRNMNPAGIFIATKQDDETLAINLDYATPAFQDFKTGAHIYDSHTETFKQEGFKRLIAEAKSEPHKRYLEKMGFEPQSDDQPIIYQKNL